MQKILSKQEYYKTDNEFRNASIPYSDYLEYIHMKQEIETADEYVVWVTGGGKSESDDEDGESSGPCGECLALDGQVFHYLSIPTTHENCKCGTIPLKLHIRLEKIEEEIEKLEKKLEKQKELEKFKKSAELRRNIEQAQKMRYNALRSGWFAYKSLTDWDYKQGGKHPELEYVGNFNYGATGRAAGYSQEVLLVAAGGTQIVQGTSSWDFVDSNFDDPIDQQYIQEGIDWYDENYGW